MQDNHSNNAQLNNNKVANIETLLLVFPPHEIRGFYKEFSQQMLLTTTAQVERHEALLKLLDIMAEP